MLGYLVPYAVLDSQLKDVGVTSTGISATMLASVGVSLALVGAALGAAGATLEVLASRRA